MKKFNITVNGKSYEVEVEEVGGSSAQVYTSAPAPKVAPKAAPAPQAAPKAAPAPVAGAMTAPMPGTVLDIKVTEGQSVKAGDVILILEAMKMENEIVAPSDGKIVKIHTSKGAAVSTGDALVTLG